MKQNVGLALESDIMGASKFLDKAALLTMVCISGVKDFWSRERKFLGRPGSKRHVDGVEAIPDRLLLPSASTLRYLGLQSLRELLLRLLSA